MYDLSSNYFVSSDNFFNITFSSLFAGKRFRYTFMDKKYSHIFESIEAIDKMGMKLIEQLDPEGFASYLKKYSNTICGRHPIAVLLNAIVAVKEQKNGTQYDMKFLQYTQSNKCTHSSDSSVSYASAAFTMS
ncbi:protein MEMO1-like [Lytechinus pictus]|uniref:protein MEMO1-like n=1 Tax=Lytechinus pictus TaxID=7653 RepID=UPI0030BA0CBA